MNEYVKHFDPSLFKVNEASKVKIKSLLIKLQKEKQLEEPSSTSSISVNESFATETPPEPQKSVVIENFTNILFEALQTMGIIPNQQVTELRSEIEELSSVVEAFDAIKNNLIDFKMLII